MFGFAATWPRRSVAFARAWLAPLIEWPLLALLLVLAGGIVAVAQQPLSYTIDIGYEEGWQSDLPFLSGWNSAEPEKARPDQLSYRWSAPNSLIRLPGVGGAALTATIHQLAASANPQASSGVLHLSAGPNVVSQPLARERIVQMLLPPSATSAGSLKLIAPTFTPAGDPRTLGVPIAKLELQSIQQPLHLPPLSTFWPMLLLPLAWTTARRWCLHRTQATILGLTVIALLLAALFGDRLRFSLAGGPLLIGALWGLIVGSGALWLIERFAPVTGVQPSPWFARSLALIIFWLMLLRYGGRLYPDSMVGDLGFHVNRQNDVIGGLIHLVSKHRGIDFPYPSATYILLAPFRLLPIAPETLVEWSDAVFFTIGLLSIAYLALRGLRNERAALLVTLTYAALAPAMMALWWSFLAHIFSQEVVALLIALIVGGWRLLGTRRGIAVCVIVLSLIFFGHFGLYINVSLLLAGLLPLLWWRYRSTPDLRSVYGLATAFVIAQALALGLFYSAYWRLISEKLSEFEQGGMGAVQGGRAATSWQALLGSLWRDGLVAHYAIIGVPLALLGGYWLWRQQHHRILVSLFWGTVVVAVVQGMIPFLTASTITTRWLSFSAWVVALGVGIVLEWLWQRGKWGQGVALTILLWIGGNTLWLWVQALGYRIRPPEPF